MRWLALLVAGVVCFGLHHLLGAASALRHAGAGAGHLVLEHDAAAAPELGRALELNDRPTVYLLLAQKAWRGVLRFDLAADAMTKLIERYPEDAGFYETRADIYWQATGLGGAIFARLRQQDLEKARQLRGETRTPAGPPDVGSAAAADRERLLGRWQLVRAAQLDKNEWVTNGKIYEFTPDELIVIDRGVRTRFTWQLDTTKDPRRLTVYQDTDSIEQSYRIDGSTLLLAQRGRFMEPPSHFETGPNILSLVLTFRRLED